MKRRTRFAALFAALGVIVASIAVWKMQQTPDVFLRGEIAVQYKNCTVPSSDANALPLLTGYFSLRCGSFAKAAGIRDGAAAADKTLPLSDVVLKNEKSRVRQLRQLLNSWNCRFSGARADLTIEGWKESGDGVVCSLYEFVWFNDWYRGHTTPESADLSGYGVRHVLRLQKEKEGFRILSDDYDEGQPTYAATDGRLNNGDYVAYAGVPSDPEPIDRRKAPALPVNAAEFVTAYRPRAAIDYADQWVAEYNLEFYPDLESLGGDCCNFVSQCIHEAGLPLTRTWTHNGKQMGSAAWISSTNLYAELTGVNGGTAVGRGVAVIRMDDAAGRYLRVGGKRLLASAVIFPGSPVFYRWSGGFAQDKRWNHTAVCVGIMGDGAPAISCHTDDKYHIKWNYGGKNTDYGTVQLTPTNEY